MWPLPASIVQSWLVYFLLEYTCSSSGWLWRKHGSLVVEKCWCSKRTRNGVNRQLPAGFSSGDRSCTGSSNGGREAVCLCVPVPLRRPHTVRTLALCIGVRSDDVEVKWEVTTVSWLTTYERWYAHRECFASTATTLNNSLQHWWRGEKSNLIWTDAQVFSPDDAESIIIIFGRMVHHVSKYKTLSIWYGRKTRLDSTCSPVLWYILK